MLAGICFSQAVEAVAWRGVVEVNVLGFRLRSSSSRVWLEFWRRVRYSPPPVGIGVQVVQVVVVNGGRGMLVDWRVRVAMVCSGPALNFIDGVSPRIVIGACEEFMRAVPLEVGV